MNQPSPSLRALQNKQGEAMAEKKIYSCLGSSCSEMS